MFEQTGIIKFHEKPMLLSTTSPHQTTDLEFHQIDSEKPFVLHTDVPDCVIAVALDQSPKVDGMPKMEDIKPAPPSQWCSNDSPSAGTQDTRKGMPWSLPSAARLGVTKGQSTASVLG